MALLARETGNATKEHEDLAFAGGKGGARVAFHWFARFADHVLFADPPLGRVDDRTGRLAYNTTLTDLLESIAQVAHSPHSIIVLGSQIFDILKAPLGDYRTNLALLIQHVIPHVCAPTPPSHERRASHCILVAGCVLHSLHVALVACCIRCMLHFPFSPASARCTASCPELRGRKRGAHGCAHALRLASLAQWRQVLDALRRPHGRSRARWCGAPARRSTTPPSTLAGILALILGAT